MSTIKNNNILLKKQFFMNLALLQARKALGNTGINPSVGCVITNNTNVISLGKTSFTGRPHAEYNAIHSKKLNYKKKNLFVTLEPCVHYGFTPPCVNTIIKSNIKKVYFSIYDLDSRTKKKCKKILEKKNVFANSGILENKVKKFYSYYKKNILKKLPYVTCKIASSNDYFIKNIVRKNITNDFSQKVSHLLRYQNNGILISYNTLVDDDPLLNCRNIGLEKYSPTRFILDKTLKIPLKSKIIKSSKKYKTIIIYNKGSNNKIKMLKLRKIKLIQLQLNKKNQFNLINVFSIIYKNKISRILIEGGKKLTQSLLKNNLIDEFFWFKSNIPIKQNGKINIRNLISKIDDKKISKKIIKTNLHGDKLYHYYLNTYV